MSIDKRIDCDWLDANLYVYVTWPRLRDKIVCVLRGHVEPNAIGYCQRCNHDLLHMSPDAKLIAGQKAINAHMAEHLALLHRDSGV